jgi:orotate phosphoribosyltransferase
MRANEKHIATALIKIGAVKFSPKNPFTYASGLKGPFYCDNRMVLGHVAERNLIIENLILNLATSKIEYDLIGGVATAGIPYASIISDRLKMPLIYVRPKPKGHGKGNQVEGDYIVNQKVVLFEDLVNQGASIVDAIVGTRSAGLIVHDCFCIVDYQMDSAKEKLNEVGIVLHSLTNFSALVDSALELNLINQSEVLELFAWKKSPSTWQS